MTGKPLSPVEQVKEDSRGLRGDLDAQLAEDTSHLPRKEAPQIQVTDDSPANVGR